MNGPGLIQSQLAAPRPVPGKLAVFLERLSDLVGSILLGALPEMGGNDRH